MEMMMIKSLALLFLVASAKALMPHDMAQIQQEKESTMPTYRLPTDVKPKTYDLSLRTDVNIKFSFEGTVSIVIETLKTTNEIVMHSNGLTIVDHTVQDIANNSQMNTTYYLIPETHFLIISCEDRFQQGKEYKITLVFNGLMSQDMYGFYKSSYITETNEERWIGATQLQPTHARRVFPCFDEPDLKATFTIKISTPPEYSALSNMPLAHEPRAGPDRWIYHEFQETGLMSTYLIAFIVSDFTNYKTPSRIPFTSWARKEAVNETAFSQITGTELVCTLENYTGINYTYPKIDQVALPDFAAGAMENWGLITYRETNLLYYHEDSTTIDKKSIALVVAHELSHMWFGNIVTFKWWEYAWLNEGFARYFQYLALDQVPLSGFKDWRLMDQFLVFVQHAIFGTDALTNTKALSSKCESPSEIQAKFGSITYNKGASVLRMLSHILTQETFQKGIQNYLVKYASNNTVPSQLFEVLEEQKVQDGQGEIPVSEFFEPWTTQPGYPVVKVTRNGNNIKVSQERFLLKVDPNAENLTWWVPLTWTTQSEGLSGFDKTQPSEWLKPTGESIEIPIEADKSEFVIFNNQETGYYRVNYDDSNWKLITQSLYNNHRNIHVLNRAQLIDDALNLARAGQMDYVTSLNLVDYLRYEEDYIPWVSAFNGFSFLDRRLIGDEEGYSFFKKYVQQLILPTYQKLGVIVDPVDNEITRLHRMSVLEWACRLGTPEYQDCTNKVVHLFKDYMASNFRTYPDVRNVAYCTALRNGGNTEWNFLWSKYQELRIANERVTILSALGCIEDGAILKEYLRKSIDPDSGIRKQDAASVFSAVYSNPKGVNIAFEFLEHNYTEIIENYGGMNALSNILIGLAERLATEEQVDKLAVFISENEGNLGPAAGAGKIAVEAARANLEWTNANKEVIINWFKEKVSSGGKAVNNVEFSSLIIVLIFSYAMQL